jgi:hypothetical protein
MRTKTLAVIAALSCLVLGACGDPGYQLLPVGWQAISDREWVKQFSDFEIQTRGITGLIGHWWVDPDLQIRNNTKSISVESAELRTATEKFSAEIYGSEPVPPSTSGYRLPVKWEFAQKRPAPSVLGDHCEIVLKLRVDGEARQINILYQK